MKLEELGRKKGKEKILMLTAYDYQMAKILDECGIDLILVGDSLGMVIQGYKDTKSVTMDDMIYHTRIVARGASKTPVIGDMPIGSYETAEEAVKNARRFIEAGAVGVKIEGNKPEVVKALIREGIPVMGHVGLLPQTAESYRVKGRKPEEAVQILSDAIELDRMGVFAIVIECVPRDLAKRITESVRSPTIGIGAGSYCDGQVLVINDLLGFDEQWSPKFVKKYANLGRIIKEAILKFKEEVSSGAFPCEEHSYS